MFMIGQRGRYHIRSLVKADNLIWDYSKTRYPWEDKAGAYGIQDPFGMKFIKKIDGDFYNVVGLPVSRLYHELKNIGVI